MNKTCLIKTVFSFAFILLMYYTAFANNAVNQDFMRSIGKIYVVVAIILLIFFGIIAFLIKMERQISKLEQQIKNNE